VSGIATPVQGIYHPTKGFMPAGWREALEVVQDYDPSLTLGRNDQTGEWLVCKKRDNGPPHPVLALGVYPEAPSREVILEKMYRNDVRRNGARIVDAIERRQKQEAEARSAAASQAAAEWAEYAEHATRGERG
jgi:hypothetical protein